MRNISKNWKNKLKTSNNGIFRIAILWICCNYLTACSPLHRFNRLVERYPFLLDRKVFDTMVVSRIESVDTTFIMGSKDTLYQEGVEIYRYFDSFRLVIRERSCTTFQQQVIIKPSKVVERHFQSSEHKNQQYVLYGFIILLTILLLLTLLK